MMEYVLHIVGHSADLKTTPTGSKDTGIFFPQDLIEFLGTDKDLHFTLYKEDCAQAMSSIISALPLYSNKGGKQISHTNIFDEATRMISMISNFFGESETAIYSKAYLSETSGGRRYLYGLEHNSFSIRKFLVADHSVLKFYKEDNGKIVIRFQTVLKPNNYDNSNNIIVHNNTENSTSYPHSPLSRPLQQIFYGAPGTGKSFGINEEIKNQGLDAVRTTFHPDSDYSTFVGAYKPAMGKAKVYGAQGPLQHQGSDVEEDKITYKFVPQAFTKAYVKAWQKMSKANDEGKIDPQILVIEEINRGNCAQIFGDLFQLLDRDDDGYSSYPIQADEDLRQHIAQELANCEDLPENIKNGTELMLPPNLYIWATMNTSDQSLFPIDSAFKRRWEWKYMKISNAGKNWKITVGDKTYDWWNFIEKINNEIAAATSSDDKKLGYFFCKPNEGDAINAERFVGKVIFYLWNDVFKDEAPAFFNVIENTEPSFDAFFEQNGEVNTAAVQKFMETLGVEAIE